MILTVLGGIVYDIGKEDADGNGPLVPRDNGTTERLWGALGLVHGYEDRDEADTKAGKEAANDECSPVVGAGLEGDAKGEY